jgi:hypothetical protein
MLGEVPIPAVLDGPQERFQQSLETLRGEDAAVQWHVLM